MRYQIKILPVTNNQSAVSTFLLRVYGPGGESVRRVENLVNNGGVLLEDLNEAAAEAYARRLRSLGVTVEVNEMSENRETEEYEVKLRDVGQSKIQVIQVIMSITGLGLAKAKKFVERQGILGVYSKQEAESIQQILNEAGATVTITSLDEEEPNPSEPLLDNQSGEYQVKLTDAGDKKVQVIGRIRAITGLGLAGAKKLVDNLGVIGVFSKTEAQNIKDILSEVGAIVSVKKLDEEDNDPDDPIVDEQNDEYEVKLTDAGDNIIPVIKVIRSITGLGLAEAKKFVEQHSIVGVYSKEDAESIKDFLEEAGAKVSIRKLIDDPNSQEFSVSGLVLLPNENPAINFTVRAYDRDLRSEQFLGEAKTNQQGKYLINYSPDQFLKAEKGLADLQLKVYDQNDKEVDIRSFQDDSNIIFNAEPKLEVKLYTLKFEQPPTEYVKIINELTPLLDGISLFEINWDDAQFLAREMKWPREKIYWVGEDQRLCQQTKLPVGIFYAWASQGIGVDRGTTTPTINLKLILDQNEDKLVGHYLDSAIENEIIPNLFENMAAERLKKIIKSLRTKS